MVAYTGIQGQNILIVSSDPANPVEGQIWYNTTSNLLKGYTYGVASWASGGNMTEANHANAGSGIQTAALTFGGVNPSVGSVGTAVTQIYNGSSWTNTGNLNTARYAMNGAGSQTATYGNGGYTGVPTGGYQNKTEHFSGSTWSNQTNSPRLISSGTGCGSQTAALVSGGYNEPVGWSQSSLLYTGGVWTTGANFASPTTLGAQSAGSAGSQTAAIVFGGYIPPSATGQGSQTWNGSAFSVAPNLNNAAYRSGAGTQNAAIAFGQSGPGGATNWTELYNGSSWTNTTGFSTPRQDIQQNSANSAPSSSALIFGGQNSSGTPIASTEEFTGAVLTTKTITTS